MNYVLKIVFTKSTTKVAGSARFLLFFLLWKSELNLIEKEG